MTKIDDKHAIRRGAERITIQMPVEVAPGAFRVQRVAAWRIPMSHGSSHVIDRMGHSGELDSRLYANAVALWHLWHKSQMEGSVVAGYTPMSKRDRAAASMLTTEAECSYHAAMARLHRHYQYLLGQLVRGGHPGPFLPNVRSGLDMLDHLTAEHDATLWADEE